MQNYLKININKQAERRGGRFSLIQYSFRYIKRKYFIFFTYFGQGEMKLEFQGSYGHRHSVWLASFTKGFFTKVTQCQDDSVPISFKCQCDRVPMQPNAQCPADRCQRTKCPVNWMPSAQKSENSSEKVPRGKWRRLEISKNIYHAQEMRTWHILLWGVCAIPHSSELYPSLYLLLLA